ncbi:TPM domain-containing protein [Algoriphagus taiwanensis]|uniref:TPM domain-containing protein n=1 Tax=Algoriphagus taiwanensis TaxID=1445656 RepID=A0ABQ6Q4H2_9BACT|nr:TPM domain-containing protein [Algoriphagus taiwanensis]
MTFPLGKSPLLFFLLLFTWGTLLAQDFPEVPTPPRLVNDFTSTLSAQEVNQLEQKLVAYNDSTSTQIAIVMIRSVGDYDIADYSFQLAEKWGIGGAQNDNGILILAATDDRKVFIATGYGMEGAVPDALAKRIVSNLIIPNFKMEAYYQGLDQATDMIIKLASGEYKAEEVVSDGNHGGAIFLLLLFIVLFVILPMIKNKNDNDNHMGGRGGGVDLWTTIMLANMLKGSSRGKWGDFSG